MPTSSSLSDSTSASLIERARDLEPGAWERLAKVYGPLVYRWCRRAGLQEADAADAVQEVFRALANGLNNFRVDAPGGFRGWLFGIARHKIVDQQRTNARTPTAFLDENVADHGVRPRILDELESEASADLPVIMQSALDQIRGEVAEHNWLAFERVALGGESASAVAAELGLTPGAVRQAKFRILRRLREELDGWPFDTVD